MAGFLQELSAPFVLLPFFEHEFFSAFFACVFPPFQGSFPLRVYPPVKASTIFCFVLCSSALSPPHCAPAFVPTVSSGSHLSPPYLFLQFNHALEQSQTLANSESIDLGYAFSCPLHVCTVCLSAAYSMHHQCCFVRLPYPCSGLSIIFILFRPRCCSLLLLLPLPVQDHWLLANSIRIPALGQALSYPLHVCIVCLSAAYSAHHQCWFVRLPYGLSPLLTLFFQLQPRCCSLPTPQLGSRALIRGALSLSRSKVLPDPSQIQGLAPNRPASFGAPGILCLPPLCFHMHLNLPLFRACRRFPPAGGSCACLCFLSANSTHSTRHRARTRNILTTGSFVLLISTPGVFYTKHGSGSKSRTAGYIDMTLSLLFAYPDISPFRLPGRMPCVHYPPGSTKEPKTSPLGVCRTQELSCAGL
jgi:hypothetical protein